MNLLCQIRIFVLCTIFGWEIAFLLFKSSCHSDFGLNFFVSWLTHQTDWLHKNYWECKFTSVHVCVNAHVIKVLWTTIISIMRDVWYEILVRGKIIVSVDFDYPLSCFLSGTIVVDDSFCCWWILLLSVLSRLIYCDFILWSSFHWNISIYDWSNRRVIFNCWTIWVCMFVFMLPQFQK